MVMMAFRRLRKLSMFASRGLFSPGVSSGSGANFGYTVLFVCLFFFFFSSKADSTADDASNKLAQV